MSTLKSYMDGKELRYRVTIGRKSFKGFKSPLEALKRGIEAAQAEDSRAITLLAGKPFEKQVGIIFGAEIANQYVNHGIATKG